MTAQSALRALAQQATPGPWHAEGGSVAVEDEYVVEVVADIHTDRRWPTEEDAAFIAACDPQTILALLDAMLWVRADSQQEGRADPFGSQGPAITVGGNAYEALVAALGHISQEEARAALAPFTETQT